MVNVVGWTLRAELVEVGWVGVCKLRKLLGFSPLGVAGLVGVGVWKGAESIGFMVWMLAELVGFLGVGLVELIGVLLGGLYGFRPFLLRFGVGRSKFACSGQSLYVPTPPL